MEFCIRPARREEVPAIMEVMHAAMAAMRHQEWFLPDDEAYIRTHIDDAGGFCLVAEAPDGGLAAYFTVKYAGLAADALGRQLGFDEEALLHTAQMDSCCVAPRYQGHHLEGLLLLAAEARLRGTPYRHFVGTVHPDNAASLYTALHRGYRIAAANCLCYGDKLRHIVQKDVE